MLRVVIVLCSFGLLAWTGCVEGDTTSFACDPTMDPRCSCTKETGLACDPGDEGCACELGCTAGEDPGCTCLEDPLCHDVPLQDCPDGSQIDVFSECPDEGYSFVLVDDLSTDMSGEAPGADIDAISVTIDDTETFAADVADFSLGGGVSRPRSATP